MFTLAHLSDTHLGPLPRARLREYFGAGNRKRLLGRLSWSLNRSRVHLSAVVDALRADVRAQAPDHVAITGDLINISLEKEFENALRWLNDFGAADWISVIPGNHDAYVPLPYDRAAGLWSSYMSDDQAASSGGGTEPFPYVRRRGPVALIGLSTAVPSPPGFATGRLGTAQIDRLDSCLGQLAGETSPPFRVVLIHHPPLAGQNRNRKKLLDLDDLEPVLRRHGAELVLHGHNHRDMCQWYRGASNPVPVLGVPSASAGLVFHNKPCAQYNLYAIGRTGGAWSCRVTVRGFDPDTRDFTMIRQFDLAPAAPA